MNESITKLLSGQYRDRLLDQNGCEVCVTDWCNNRIVNTSDILLASLMKGEPGMDGILFLAIGEGDLSWDNSNPLVASNTNQLHQELLRHPISSGEVVFLDEMNQPAATPTSRLEINVEFIGSDIVNESYLSLREFGLFGGDASSVLNSGYLINYVIHPRIDLTPNATLTRKLHLDFNSAVPIENIPQPIERTSWITEATVAHIDGVGDTYLSGLNSAGITTIGELANTDVDMSVDIPRMKFMEFRSRAQLAIQSLEELVVYESIQKMYVREVFSTSIADLSNKTHVAIKELTDLYNKLYSLQLALDHKFLQKKTLNELNVGSG